MGLIPPDPPPDYGPGDDCLTCYASGHTPSHVFMRFLDVDACPGNPAPPNGLTFTCEQDPVNPCLFSGSLEIGGNTWVASYVMSVAEAQLELSGAPAKIYFYAEEDPCSLDFPTNENTCALWDGENGSCKIKVFEAAIIIGLTHHYHFVTNPDTRYEFFPCGIDHWNYRLANVNGHTNVLFLIDDEDFDILPADHDPGPF